ncbi:jg27019 [Pararge aegeria aegeria]|uniref:Jg27019 protein n=1 Tax=Pararge aegeria aegeria TaxID=348720 RepID=A0A8S4SP57_9NEOP|nr:jg27019 [Pararge aegeria aegeria]
MYELHPTCSQLKHVAYIMYSASAQWIARASIASRLTTRGAHRTSLLYADEVVLTQWLKLQHLFCGKSRASTGLARSRDRERANPVRGRQLTADSPRAGANHARSPAQ